MPNTAGSMSAVEDGPTVPRWRTALTLLVQAKDRLEGAGDADKQSAQMEYDEAMAAYLAVAKNELNV
jgi:hypothetical protein